MKAWILKNIDIAPHGLAMRMNVALILLNKMPSYRPPIEQWQAELARYASRGSVANPTAPCAPHATWCHRFGLPTDEAKCAACTAVREDRTIDPVTGLNRAALHLQQMRDRGRAYGAATCAHRIATGEYREERCCGNKIKQIPIINCARTGKEARCQQCPDKEPSP